LAFARVSPELKADLDRHHLTEAIGAERIFHRLRDALAAYEMIGNREVSRPI